MYRPKVIAVLVPAMLATLGCGKTTDSSRAQPGRPAIAAAKEKAASQADLAKCEKDPPAEASTRNDRPITPAFEEMSIEAPNGQFAAVEMGDVNRDGYAEILSGQRDGKEGLYLFTFDGSTWTGQQITQRGEYGGLALADVTGDRILDVLAVTTKGSPKGLEICIGYRMVIADFDGEGLNDMAVGTSSGLRLFRGNGCKGAESGWWRTGSVPDRGSQTMQPVVGDLNKDGNPDLVFTSDSGVFALLNHGTQGFSRRVACGLPDKGEYSGCCLFDWDGDGDLDVACSSFQGLGVHFYRNTAIGE